MKKRKMTHSKESAPAHSESDTLKNILFLKHDDEFHFECSLCGECCRDVEHSVMLEPYDLFRIAGYLKQRGQKVSGIEQIISEYADVRLLGDSEYPVFLLKTQGQRNACVFLHDGRCSIHEAKPRACRLYPMGAWPNEAFDDFDYFIASQKRHHFDGPAIRVVEWMDEYFTDDEREIVLLDANAMRELAPILRGLQNAGIDQDRILQPLILFKYVYFELDEPYVPQFIRNTGLLKSVLLGLTKKAKK